MIDGIGGQAAGEKAADIAITRVRARLERQTGTVEDRIREAITVANNEILQASATNPEWHGMACVLTVAVAENGRAGPWTIARVFEHLPKLAELRSRKSGRLSGGEQEMLAIGRGLILNPRLFLLDEPSQGLAPLIVQELFSVIAAMRKEGISVLLVEQNVRAAVEIADRAYVLDDGRVVFAGAAAEFAKDEERVRALAGASAEKWQAAE